MNNVFGAMGVMKRKLTVNQDKVLTAINAGVSTVTLEEATGLNWRQIQACVGALYRRGLLTVVNVSATVEKPVEEPTEASASTSGLMFEEVAIRTFEAEVAELYQKDKDDGYGGVWEPLESLLHHSDLEWNPDDESTLVALQEELFSQQLRFLFKSSVVALLESNGIDRAWDVAVSEAGEMSQEALAKAIQNGYVPKKLLWDNVADTILSMDSSNISAVRNELYAEVVSELMLAYPNGYFKKDKETYAKAQDARQRKSSAMLDKAIKLGKAQRHGIGFVYCPVWQKANEHLFIKKACKEVGITVKQYSANVSF